MDIVNYALCNIRCKKSRNCLRYINRNSNEKAVINFKPVCNINNNYQWFYSQHTQKSKRKKELKNG